MHAKTETADTRAHRRNVVERVRVLISSRMQTQPREALPVPAFPEIYAVLKDGLATAPLDDELLKTPCNDSLCSPRDSRSAANAENGELCLADCNTYGRYASRAFPASSSPSAALAPFPSWRTTYSSIVYSLACNLDKCNVK